MPNLKPKTQNLKPTGQSGIAVLFSLLLVAFLLSILLSLTSIWVPKIDLTRSLRNSSSALYSAESAVEWCLYALKIAPTPAPALPIMANGATYTDGNGGAMTSSDCVSPLEVIGTFQGVSRAYELTF